MVLLLDCFSVGSCMVRSSPKAKSCGQAPPVKPAVEEEPVVEAPAEDKSQNMTDDNSKKGSNSS